MSTDLIKFLILWGPTFLFLLILLMGFLVGVIRGFRKSIILFIHMLVIGGICLGLYLYMVNRSDWDVFLLDTTNQVLSFTGKTLQEQLDVSNSCTSMREITLQLVLKNMDNSQIVYHVVNDGVGYIMALAELVYRLVLFIICLVVYSLLSFLCYLIYLIFYPVRRKAKKHNRKFQNGEVPTPYKKRRLLGGSIGLVRNLITGVIGFSFLGALLFIVTGDPNAALPSRDQEDGTTISFGDETYNEIYDYYSYVCEAGNTGIFGILNGLRDSNNTPYYFYIADMVLQGSFSDENLGINDKFYLRDETGYYVTFMKQVASLLIKYSGDDVSKLFSGEADAEFILSIMAKEGFAAEFAKLIDNFESTPYIGNLTLSALTSLINHIDMATEDETIIKLVNKMFDPQDGIKVTDLATEQDIKTLFKAVVDVVAAASSDLASTPQTTSALDDVMTDTKRLIGYVQRILPSIQSLSLFNDRKDKGDKLLANLYVFCTEEFISEDMDIPEVPSNISWINEFNVLLKAVDPLLTIASEIYDDDQETMIQNLLHMFDSTNPKATLLEESYDKFVAELCKSNLLDVVFKSSLIGDQVDTLLINMTQNENAVIPKNIDYASKDGNTGECEVLLGSLKYFIKNGGGELYELMTNGGDFDAATITKIFTLFKSRVNEADDKSNTLIEELMKSKLLHYIISSYLTYADFGGFAIYIPKAASDELVEGSDENKVVYQIVKKEEILLLVDTIVNCEDLVIELIDNQGSVDYAKLLTNEVLLSALEKSYILKGTISNVIIEVSKDGVVVLPKGYDDPEEWLSSGEIDSLVAALRAVSTQVDENGDPIINGLMHGRLDASTLFDLDDTVINSLCDSIVLQYTLSDMITSLGSSDFAIIVPRAALHKVNAETTVEGKTINVVEKSELKTTFNEIKKIIKVDVDIKIDFNAIFANKEEILSSTMIQATLINAIIKMISGENSVIGVPKPYIEDFEKYKTDVDLTGNRWLGPTDSVKDDELYLLLAGIEVLIADEDGNIPEDFDLEADIASDLKITKAGLTIMTASAILNASMSKNIVNSLITPTEVYVDEYIVKDELDVLFDCLFEFMGKSELTFDDFLEIDINSISFTETRLRKLKDSKILYATISDYMAKIDGVIVPLEITESVEVIGEKETVNQLKLEEYDALVDALVLLFANGDGELIIEAIDFDNILVTNDNVETIVKTSVFNATIADTLLGIEIVTIPDDSLDYKGEALSGSQCVIVDQTDLINFIQLLIKMIGGEAQAIDPVNIVLDNMVIDSDFDVKKSAVMSATISSQIRDFDVFSVPTTILEEKEIYKHSGTTKDDLITDDELDKLLKALIKVMGKDGKITLNLGAEDSISTEDILINDDNIESIFASAILSTTISTNVIDTEELYVPLTDTELINLYNISDPQRVIEDGELRRLFKGLLEFMNGEISLDGLDADFEVIKQDSITEMLKSSILNATISKQITEAESLTIPNNIVSATEFVKQGEGFIIAADQTQALFDALFLTSGTSDGDTMIIDITNDFNLTSVNLPDNKEDIGKMVDSLIMAATFSANILQNDDDLNTIVVLYETLENYNYNGVASEYKYIKKAELINLIYALTAGLGLTSADAIDDFYISIPTEETAKRALVDSQIIRATITRTVLNESNASKEGEHASGYSGVEVNTEGVSYTKMRSIQGENILDCIVFTDQEILNIINGIHAVFDADYSFGNVDFDLVKILSKSTEEKKAIFTALASSSFYRVLVSHRLADTNYYKVCVVDTPTATLSNGHLYTYQNAQYPGYYIIQDGNMSNVYYSYLYGANTIEEIIVFAEDDIIALENVIVMNWL